MAPSQSEKENVAAFSKAIDNTNKKTPDKHDNNNNKATRKAFIVLVLAICCSIILSVISYYRANFGDVAERRKKFEQANDPSKPGEDVSKFAQRLRAEVMSANVGLVQHDRVGGFALQIQADTPANTSLVAVPLSSCISVENLRRGATTSLSDENSNNNIPNLFVKLAKFKTEQFDKNKGWMAQLGIPVSAHAGSASNEKEEAERAALVEKQKEVVWEQVQLVTFLIHAKQHCDKNLVTDDNNNQNATANEESTSYFSHWCPWINNIVVPSTNIFLPMSDLRWRPEVTARCLRQSTRMQYEASLLQVSVMSKIFDKFNSTSSIPDSSSSTSSSSLIPTPTVTRPLVEWALFVLRTRSHQHPSSGDTMIVPLLEMNDKRVGAHLYRKASRQNPTAMIVFDQPKPQQNKDKKRRNKSENTNEVLMVHLVTAERHSKGAYPLTAPGSWSSTLMASSPTSIVQSYGTTPHALPVALQNKIFQKPVSLKDESENIFARDHFISIPIFSAASSSPSSNSNNNINDQAAEQEKQLNEWKNVVRDECLKQNFLTSASGGRLSFNISSGLPAPRTHYCLLDGKKSDSKEEAMKTSASLMYSAIKQAQKTSILSPEALFACKSVATKQKEGIITDSVRILGGKQAQALIDVDEVMMRGGDRAKKYLLDIKKKFSSE